MSANGQAGSQKINLEFRIGGDETGVSVQAFLDGKPLSPRFSASYETLTDYDFYNPTGAPQQLVKELIQLASEHVAKGYRNRA